MYKRRKKVMTPQASSTVVGNFSSSTSSLSQASYVESEIASQRNFSQRGFSDTESFSNINSEKNEQKQMNNSQIHKKKDNQSAVQQVLEMLSTPPQSKSAMESSIREESRFKRPNTLNSLQDFIDLLVDAGLLLSDDDSTHNILRKDQAVFVRDLSKNLKNKGASFINRFMKYLEEYLSDKEHFQKSLSPTKSAADCITARGEFQECFIRLLLMIGMLQTRIAQYLLDRLGELLSEADHEGFMWVRLILPPMRYLPCTDKTSDFTKTLFDIIHSVSVTMVQHEIINCLPDIIGDDQRDSVATELMELMKLKPLLMPSILTALGNLCLEGNVLYEVKLTLIKSLRREPLEHLPAFVSFIFKPPLDSHINEYLNGIRSELVICHFVDTALVEYLHAREAKQEDVAPILIEIFEKLKDSVLVNAKLAEAWLKNITKVKNHSVHKPIDLMMCLILHSTTMCISKKKIIEAAVRYRIRHGYFKRSLINDTIRALACVLKVYFSDLLKFLSSLLQSSDVIVSNFASVFFEECFFQMEKEYCRAVVLELMDNIRIFRGNAGAGLSLLNQLTTKHVEKMAPFLSITMRLLDIVSDLNVFEVRQLMNTICIMAFSESDELTEEPTSVQNDIYMIVQKQLACPDPPVFKSGVICSLVAIKHMVTLKEGEPNNTPNTEELNSKSSESGGGNSSTEILNRISLNTNSEKAYSLLELVLAATSSNSEAHELCYDQLSYIVMTSDNMDKAFMKKISIEMQNNLQNHYIIAASEFSPSADELESVLQFCIDSELEDPIVLNISQVVIKESKQGLNISSLYKHNLVALPGLLRVIRGLQLADLSEIDALLGCYISFPHPTIFTKFNTLDSDVQYLTMDCLFHTCNWFREILNSFVYLIKESSSPKILMRLRLLVHLQTLIATCLPLAIGYSPPKYLDAPKSFSQLKKKSASNSQAPRRIKKKKKDSPSSSGETKRSSGAEDNDVENVPTQPEESLTDDEDTTPQVEIEFSYFQHFLRELDFDVCLIFTQQLTLNPVPPKDGTFSSEFGPKELMLLLDDLNNKLKYRLKPKSVLLRNKNQEPAVYNNFLNIPVDLVIKNTSKLILHIINHLQKIVEYNYNLLQENDGVYDASGMFGSGTAEIKKCTALILSVFDAFFSWPELKSEVYMKCLLKTLLKLGGETMEKAKSKSVPLNIALQSAVNYLKTISKCMLDLTSAYNLVTLIKTLNSLQDENDDKKEVDIGEVCDQFLKRKWYDGKGNELKGTQLNKHQASLLEIYLTSGEKCLDNVRNVLSNITDEIANTNSTLTMLPHFNKTNLNILIRSMSRSITAICKYKVDASDLQEQLQFWDKIVDCLQYLVIIVKAQDAKVNLRQLLKGCFPILKLFKTNGMSVCSHMFKLDAIQVTQTIKKLQVVTRYIQSVCNFSKITKDRSLLQQLPGIRGVLESIVLSVKNIMLQNKCVEAFFMGSMKNKDHHGEVILSQESIDTNSIETTSSIGGDEAGDDDETIAGSDDNEGNCDSDTSINTSITEVTTISEAY